VACIARRDQAPVAAGVTATDQLIEKFQNDADAAGLDSLHTGLTVNLVVYRDGLWCFRTCRGRTRSLP